LKEEDDIEKIEKLTKIDGVGVPIASAILAMNNPNKFAIIDINVLTALEEETGWKEDEWEGYKRDSEIYKKYMDIIRNKAKKRELKTLGKLSLNYLKKGKRLGHKEKEWNNQNE